MIRFCANSSVKFHHQKTAEFFPSFTKLFHGMQSNLIPFRIQDMRHEAVSANGGFGEQDLSARLFNFRKRHTQVIPPFK
jgi:hypothetical protein